MTSPRPWKVIDNKGITIFIDDGGGEPVAHCRELADARLIVSAVNAHDKLVEACNMALGWVRKSDGDTSDTYKALAEALKLAEH